jgi:hypothetical protein
MIYKSVIRHIVDLIGEIGSTTGNQNVLYHDWESRSDENDLPKQTLIGLEGFTFSENKGLWVVRFGIALSSYQDDNLLNEIEMLGVIHEFTGEGAKFKMLDPVEGEEVSEMVVAAWDLSPMGQSQLRNYRTVSIELLRTAGDGDNN